METHAGHNRSMQCARLEQGGETLFGFADLVPMRAHVPFAWIMGFDLYPVETLEAKKKLLPQAARENWTCLFYHDPDQAFGRIVEDEGKLKAVALNSSYDSEVNRTNP
jgi:glyoxylase-like metal-dependent hydrolase (beta-lactamase superfamily II)